MKILVLNSGSSSLKYQLIDMETEEVLAKGNYERIGQYNSFLTHKVNGEKHNFEKPASNHEKAIKFVLDRLLSKQYGVIKSVDEIDGIGHRIVHGGEKFTKPVIINDEVIKEIEDCIELAPLHNPAAILGIEACINVMPGKVNVAVFDTVAQIVNKPIEELKIINCHLGQGASVCAIKNGKSVDTSMGFTPLGGIPMGTRSGDLDPSVVTYIAKLRNHTPEEMNEILNKKSGVYGISEVSVDFRDIEAEYAEGNHKAIMALENFAYQVARLYS